MAQFDLVVLDLDGTLLDPDREAPIRPRVKAAVQRAVEQGVGVTLATGRTWEYAQHRLQELGIGLPLVTGQGSGLVAADGRILWESRLNDELAERLTRAAAQMPEEVCFYFRDRVSDRLLIRQNRADRPQEVYHHLLGPQTQVDPDLNGYLPQHQVLKFVVFDESDEGVERWTQWAGPQANVMRTHHLLVEGTAPGVNKGTGLERLIEHLAVPPDRVLVIGDNYNDLPMFAVAGTCVAMGQAPEDVRRAADWVAPSFVEDGVAAALEHFIR